jgi:asparagine synthase (glutamine-hydrolysing)
VEGGGIPSLFDEPFADSSAIPTYYLCRETSKQIKVVLSGDGGDELFGGYRRFRAGLLSDRYSWLLKPLLSPVNFKSPPPRSWKGFVSRFKSKLHLTPLQQQLSWNSYFDQSDFEKFFGDKWENAYLRIQSFEQKTEGLTIIQKILYYNFKTYLFDDLLPKVDRMSMAHGLEVRTPFLDKALIEFAFTLPDHFKVTSFETKKILKDTFSVDLGYDFVHRKKQGFALPIENFLNKEKFREVRQIKKIWPQFRWGDLSAKELEQSNHHYKVYLLMSLEKTLGQFL